jgi:hypothetical protein
MEKYGYKLRISVTLVTNLIILIQKRKKKLCWLRNYLHDDNFSNVHILYDRNLVEVLHKRARGGANWNISSMCR